MGDSCAVCARGWRSPGFMGSEVDGGERGFYASGHDSAEPPSDVLYVYADAGCRCPARHLLLR